MFNAIDELKPISNTLLTRIYDDVRTEYPKAFQRINNALAIVNDQTHHTAGVQLAINNVKAKLEELLEVDSIGGETLLHEITDLITAMENIAVAQKTSITPHKGGRTQRIEARLTPDEKQRVMDVCQRQGLSFADWVMEQVEKLEQNRTPD